MAVYPTSIKQFTTKVNIVDTVNASDVDSLQDEVRAIQMVLGINPHVANTNNGPVSYANVSSRLDALQTGESTLLNAQPPPVTAPTPPPTTSTTATPIVHVYNAYVVVPAQSYLTAVCNQTRVDNVGGQANGTGITIGRSGYYLIEGGTIWMGGSYQGQNLTVRVLNAVSGEVIANTVAYQQYPAAWNFNAVRGWASTVYAFASGTVLHLQLMNSGAGSVAANFSTIQAYFLSEN